MLAVFLLQNQCDQYLSKSGEWLNGADSKALYRTVHKDEAINQKVEVAVKQADTRAKIVNGFQLPNGQVIRSENEPLPISLEPEIDNTEKPSSGPRIPDEEVHEAINTDPLTGTHSQQTAEAHLQQTNSSAGEATPQISLGGGFTEETL